MAMLVDTADAGLATREPMDQSTDDSARKAQSLQSPVKGDLRDSPPPLASPSSSIPEDDSESEPEGEEDAGHRFTNEETIVIFDWDDTVLPSSWVQDQGLRLDADSMPSPEQQQQLAELARHAARTMRKAKKLGTVVLVTNAERGWIELSCLKFLPALYPALESVKILSARTEYETPALSSPFDWKLKAFISEIERVLQTDPNRRKNILSVGDSSHEREALIRATHFLPNCRTKSLKFVERPTIDQLCKEHLMICGSCFRRIVHHDGNLDLCIRPL